MNLRSTRLVLALVALLAFAALGWWVPLSRDGQAAPAPSSDAAFKGKVLLVTTNNMMMTAFVLLEKGQVQRIGEHSWIIGKGVGDSHTGSWYKDRTIRIQMDHIVSITEFDDLKDAKKALESGGVTTIGGVLAPGTPPIPADAAPAGSAPVPPPPPLPSAPKQ